MGWIVGILIVLATQVQAETYQINRRAEYRFVTGQNGYSAIEREWNKYIFMKDNRGRDCIELKDVSITCKDR
jgi:hypothetical protein